MDRDVRRPLSVRARIVASILAVTALGMLAAGATAFLVHRERVLADVDAQLAQTVQDVRYLAAGRPASGGATPPTRYVSVRELLRATVQQLVPRGNEATLGLVNGRPAYEPGIPTRLQLADHAELIARIGQETVATDGVVQGTAQTSDGPLRYVAIPLQVTGDPEQGVFLAAYDLDAELAGTAAAFRTYAFTAAIALVAVGLVGWFVAGRLLRPIRTLRDTAERISMSDLSERIPVRGRDDVSELTATVNAMLDRLHDAATSQQQLLDDVGHELKTPLTIVRGHLELMDEHDPADVAQTRELVLDELDRTAGLVSDISLLAAVQRPRWLHRRPTDVADLTAQVTHKAAGLSDQHQWRCARSADVVVALDPDRITQAWLQLAANAARHAPAGSSIVLASELAGDRLRLSVTDRGPGIPPEAQSRIFERFARASEGRGTEGAGLGLAIVAAIARAHGGDVGVDSELGSGSVFHIDLPVSGDSDPPPPERRASAGRADGQHSVAQRPEMQQRGAQRSDVQQSDVQQSDVRRAQDGADA